MSIAGVDLDAFTTGLGLGFLVAFAAWVPLAALSIVRRLMSID